MLNRRKPARFNGQNNEDERASCISAVYKPMNQMTPSYDTICHGVFFVSQIKHP